VALFPVDRFVIKRSEPEKIYLNNVFIKTCKENEDTKGPFIYQTFNISPDNKNFEFAVSNGLFAGKNKSHNIIYHYNFNLSKHTSKGPISLYLYLLKSNVNNLGFRFDSVKIINKTYNVMYNEMVCWVINGEIPGHYAWTLLADNSVGFSVNICRSLFAVNPLLNYTIVISFTLYNIGFLYYPAIGTYNLYLTNFPIGFTHFPIKND